MKRGLMCVTHRHRDRCNSGKTAKVSTREQYDGGYGVVYIETKGERMQSENVVAPKKDRRRLGVDSASGWR